MRAVVIEEFGVPPVLRELPDPAAPDGGVVVRVERTGLCRSDWHALAGHDPDVRLPQVPGHEFAGTVHAVGAGVDGVRIGERVTAPFVLACGDCRACRAGDQQVCRAQRQPGFTDPGSFAELVAVPRAAVNLVPLPETVPTVQAAVLGCRFATAWRALTGVGRLRAGEWVAVHGCGGVGLSAVMIAAAAGARVLAVDVAPAALELAARHGAEQLLDASPAAGDWTAVGAAVRELTGGGAQLSLDCLGAAATCAASIAGLRERGRHVQVGLLPPGPGLPGVPMHLVVAGELELLGAHGMPTHDYPQLLALVAAGRLRPAELVTATIGLDAAPAALHAMGGRSPAGVTLIDPWA